MRSKSQEDLIAHGSLLAVEDALSKNDFRRVSARDADVGDDGNADMLLDVEWPGVQRPDVFEGLELPCGEQLFESLANGQRDKLDDNTADEKTRVWRLVRKQVL